MYVFFLPYFHVKLQTQVASKTQSSTSLRAIHVINRTVVNVLLHKKYTMEQKTDREQRTKTVYSYNVPVLVSPSETTCLTTSHLHRHSQFSDNESRRSEDIPISTKTLS